MRKRWISLLAVAGLLAVALTGGAVMAQETSGEESADPTVMATPPSAPTTILGRVAAILGLDEETVQDAFQQARKDQKTEAYREQLDRKVEKELLTPEEADEQFLWFQSRPDSLTGSFWQGGHRQSAFGHAKRFGGKRFGMRMQRRGGRWGGNDRSSFGGNGHSGQQGVTPFEPSSEPGLTSH